MKKIISNLLILAAAVIVPFMALEIALRLFFPIYAPQFVPEKVNEPFIAFDPELGWFHKRDFTAWIESKEYKTRAYLNRRGTRGKLYDYAKPEGVRRILILGDSLAFGLGVNDDETFPAVLEETFRENGEAAEVINLGVNGYGTVQEFLLLDREGMKYRPDIVVVAFFLGNDIINNISGYEYGHYKPFVTLEEDWLIYENYPVEEKSDFKKDAPIPVPRYKLWLPFKDFLRDHSYTYIFLRQRYDYLMHRLGLRGDHEVASDPENLEMTERVFLKMKSYCDARNMELVVLIIPTREQMLGVLDAAFQERFAAFCDKHHLETIDLLPFVMNRNDLLFTLDVHWNKEGHAFIARALYEYLREPPL